MGVGSLFNHNPKSNIDWIPRYKTSTILYKAKRDIRKGSQLFIDYGYGMAEAQRFLSTLA